MYRQVSYFAYILLIVSLSSHAAAQEAPQVDSHHESASTTAPATSSDDGHDMQMPGMAGTMRRQVPETFIDEILQHSTSGTSAQPNSVPQPMIMTGAGKWMFMFHAEIFLNLEQQTGPSGGDKFFSTNWFMPMAQRSLGPGQLTLRSMLSLEPGTITDRFYPELFQQGETAFGRPLVNGQHPHNFFMELAALYDLKISPRALLSFYAAPVGDPAMGPTAYAHRISSSENPLAPLGHHLEDSTHIAYDVVTTGLTYRWIRVEASGFHGQEPGESRWGLSWGAIDSWSTRVTVQPGQNWSAQYSFAHLTSPEALEPQNDIQRMTASVTYNRPLARGNWASTVLWGRNHVLPSGENFNSYLAESTLRFTTREYVWGRIENVDRTNELLLAGQPQPPGFQERFLARIQAYTVGYDHDFHFLPGLATALGAEVTFYGKPAFLDPIYGQHPLGAILFVRLRPTGSTHSSH
ncbi:MAG TPA: hypothetical protein VIX19_05760 [Terriglobales bacterium]